MATDIDTLQIQINAQAQKANTAIDTLVRKLDSLTTSLSKVDGSKLNSLSSGIGRLGTSVTQMNGVKSDNLINIAKTLNKIAKIDYSKLNAAGSGLSTLSQGMATIGGLGNLSNITPAVNAIKNLARTDLSGFDTGKMQTIASTLSSFANQLGTSTKIDASVTKIISAMARLANSGQSIGNVSTYFPVLGQHVTSLVQSLSGAGAIDIGIAKVVDGIARLASAGNKVGITVANLQSLGDGVVNLVNRLNALPKVNANIANLILGLGNIASSGTRAGSVVNGLSARLNTFSNSANTSTKRAFSLASAIGKVYATYWMFFRAFRLIWKAINISSDLTEVQNVVDVTFGDMAYKVEEFAKNSIEQFGMSELALKQYSSRFQSMGTNMGVNNSALQKASEFLNKQTNGYVELSDSMSDVSLTLTKLTADMASFYNVEQKDVAEDLASIFTGQTRPLRTYGLDLTEATLKEWALKNGLDANIDSMSQAEKTMLRYQYVMANTGAAQGDFARTADTWANQVRILKQNFEALGSTIGGAFINFLKPLVKALNSAIGKLREFAIAVSNSLGVIFGWKYEQSGGGITSDIEDSTGGMADNLGSAADNAKKLKSYLLGIDELNVLNEDSDSGASGGGASAGAGSASQDQWTKTDSILKNFESDLDSLYKLGDFIGQKLTDAMNSIDWDSVYEGARNFGSGLASFLNGLISPDLFGAVGRTIAGALNTAIYVALSFWEEFDFYDFGVSIATGINDFFATFDFEALAKTLNTWVDGLKDTIAGFLDTITWSKILEATSTFLGTLELDTVEVLIGAFLIKNSSLGLAKLLASALLGKLTLSVTIPEILLSISSFSLGNMSGASFQVIGSQIVGWIEEAIEELIPDLVKDFLGEFVMGFSLVGAASGANPIAAVIGGLVAGIPFKEEIFNVSWAMELFDGMIDSFSTAFDGKRQDWMDIGSYIFEGIIDGLLGAVAFVIQPIHNLFKLIYDGICSVFGIHSPATTMIPIGENIALGLLDGILDEIKGIGSWIRQHIFQPFIDGFKNAFGIHSPSTKMKEQGVFIIEGLLGGLEDKIEDVWSWLEKIPTKFTSFFENLPSEMGGIGENVIFGLWNGMKSIWSGVSGWLSGVAGKISGTFSKVLDIHSPSRVMFAIGGYAIEGLKNGMEALYDPTLKSLENFSYDMQVAPTLNNFSHPTQKIYSTNGCSAEMANSIKQAIKEVASEMLEPYLSDIAESNRTVADKDFSVAIGDKEIYKASIRGSKSYGKLLVT